MTKKPTLRKFLVVTTLFSFVFLLQNCGGQKKTTTTDKPQTMETSISYDRDLKPIMERSCTPCHFPEKGQKEMLYTYEQTKRHIREIIFRIQLPPEDLKYMPFKSKRPALSEAEVKLFIEWYQGGMPG